jgi:hypothetical protein
MRVLAATFDREDAARAVLNTLRRRFDLSRRDASVAPLGSDDPRERGFFLLAGRFYDQRVAEVHRLVESFGGRVVEDIDEVRTQPGLAGAARSAQPSESGRTFGTQTWRATNKPSSLTDRT